MVQASGQFSPAQLLEAGRRAEAEGSFDLAAQFYRQLTEHYPHAAEAPEARNGLGRIGAAQNQVWHSNRVVRMNGGAYPAETAHRSSAARSARRRPVAPRDHYRAGRGLAVVFEALGWLMVATAFVAPVLLVALGGGLASVGVLPIAGAAAGLSALGLLVVLLGQAARALFDQANATRELAALERAKAGSD